MAQDRQKKVALLGATGYQFGSSKARVECFNWERLKKAGNLADFDMSRVIATEAGLNRS